MEEGTISATTTTTTTTTTRTPVPTPNLGDIGEVWGELQPHLNQIIAAEESDDPTQRPPRAILPVLYSLVFQVCTSAQAHAAGVVDQLYKRVGQVIDGYCRERLAPHLRGLPHDRLATQVLARWERFTKVLKRFTGIFSYMDRHYCHITKLRTTKEVGINSFRLLVVDPVVEELSAAVLNALQEAQSSGSVADPGQIKAVVNLFVELGSDKLFFYHEHIEEPYLTRVRTLLRKEKARLQEVDEAQRNEQLTNLIEKHKELARQVLHSSTEAKIASQQ